MPRKALHPNFREKKVLNLECRFCGNMVCSRGMRAILLADTNVQLYSTDLPPYSAVDQVNDAYCTEKCRCKIKDIACLQCGNVVGYTVIFPCRTCLESCNNGHFWMFHSTAVSSADQLDQTGESILTWSKLVEDEEELKKSSSEEDLEYEQYCR